jgi:hypothetical protein
MLLPPPPYAKTPSTITSPTQRSRTEISPGTRAHHTQPLHRAHSPPIPPGAHRPQQSSALDARAPAQISSSARSTRELLKGDDQPERSSTPHRRGADDPPTCQGSWLSRWRAEQGTGPSVLARSIREESLARVPWESRLMRTLTCGGFSPRRPSLRSPPQLDSRLSSSGATTLENTRAAAPPVPR